MYFESDMKKLFNRKKELNWTNEQLAEESGVPLETIDKMFSGMAYHLPKEVWKSVFDVMGLAHLMVKESSAYHVEKSNDKRKTVEDYYALPEDVRAELIDGVIYDMTAPSGNHQIILMEIAVLVHAYLKKTKLKCRAFFAPYDVRLDQDDYTMVQPDFLIICDRSKYEGGICCEGAPDLVMEIVSASDPDRDYRLKLRKYKNAGVREYWIIDPEEMRITVHTFGVGNLSAIYSFDDIVKSKIYPGLEIDFKEIKAEMLEVKKVERKRRRNVSKNYKAIHEM